MTDTSSDIASLTFEKALAELDQIVRNLEGGNVPLEESIALFGRGEQLKSHCDRLLAQAEARVDKIRLDAEGKPVGLEALPEA